MTQPDDPAEPFDHTASEIAREVPVIPETVRGYADRGLLECRRLGNGTRLFQRSAIEKARELRNQRLGNRGRRAD